MRHIEPIGEDEMVAVFLRTEIASTRFARDIRAILARDGQPASIVEQPDLADPRENAYRRPHTDLCGHWQPPSAGGGAGLEDRDGYRSGA
jgi:hypothetical protein